jgi:hypothetical protein
MDNVTQETLELMGKAIADSSSADVLSKAGYVVNSTATQGLQGYDLSRS